MGEPPLIALPRTPRAAPTDVVRFGIFLTPDKCGERSEAALNERGVYDNTLPTRSQLRIQTSSPAASAGPFRLWCEYSRDTDASLHQRSGALAFAVDQTNMLLGAMTLQWESPSSFVKNMREEFRRGLPSETEVANEDQLTIDDVYNTSLVMIGTACTVGGIDVNRSDVGNLHRRGVGRIILNGCKAVFQSFYVEPLARLLYADQCSRVKFALVEEAEREVRRHLYFVLTPANNRARQTWMRLGFANTDVFMSRPVYDDEFSAPLFGPGGERVEYM